MDFQRIWYIIKKKTKRAYKKVRRFFKRYVRLLVRHTKAGDYSVLMYTIFALIAFILVIVLMGKLFSAIGGGNDKDKNKEVKNPSTEIATPVDVVEDPEITAKKQLATQCAVIYEGNKDYMLLVNSSNPLAEDYTFEHHTLNCGYDIDKRIYDDLANMLNACNDAGYEYNIISAYRSRDTQQSIVDNTIAQHVSEGMSEEEARSTTLLSVQPAGCSEHETGLALDISGPGVTSLEEYLETEPTNKWLIDNSYKYGFILRYPQNKIELTGVGYEPWHFRYVGIEAASFMHNNNLCLEEFYELLNYR